MRRPIPTSLAAAALLALGACGGGEPGAPTAEEARELNNAAEMLDTEDASADSLTIEDPALGNGDAPAQTGELPVDSGNASGAVTNAQ
jgi:hypothetical protein